MNQFPLLEKNDLNVLVINFIDMLSHARTESKMVRELAHDEAAYRSLTLSWFRHSIMSQLLRQLAQTDCQVIITTDHGSIRTNSPVKIIGDRNTNTNLRYKLGKNLAYDDKDIFVIKEPQKAFLPPPTCRPAMYLPLETSSSPILIITITMSPTIGTPSNMEVSQWRR